MIVSVADAIAFTGIEGSTKFTDIVNGINDFVETYCGRTFDPTSYDELAELNPYQIKFNLSSCPLITISSLIDSSGDDVTIYGIDWSSSEILLQSSFWSAFPTLEKTSEWLEAEYQAGYETMPSDLRLAVLSMIEDRYRLGDSSIISERLSDRTYRKQEGGWPLQALEILDNYKL